MFCSFTVERKSDAGSLQENESSQCSSKSLKPRSEWAQFLESAASQWIKEKPRIPIVRNVGGGRKNKWTSEEDKALESAVRQYGPESWRKVAVLVPGRTSKQCRERWLAKLSPGLVLQDWTANEDLILVEKQRELGNQWAKIKSFLPGRSPVAVKNRWTWLCRRDVPNHSIEFEKIVQASQQKQSEDVEDLFSETGNFWFDRDEYRFSGFHFNPGSELHGIV